MKLLPSLKSRKRYLVFEVQAAEKFTFQEIKEEVDKALLLFLGQLGLARAEPLFVTEKFRPETQRFILKVSPAAVDETKLALALSKKIKKTPVIIRSIVTSGTIKKASTYL